MFVVESNSTGAEIFCERIPGSEYLVVRLLCGTSIEARAGFLLRLVVKARESEVAILADYSRSSILPLMIRINEGCLRSNEALTIQVGEYCG